MNSTNMILQGTDGVRGVVRLSHDPEVRGMSPADAFLTKGIITEEFMELYTYSHITGMATEGLIKKGDSVVIGWDPRDKDKNFVSRAVDGIRKAGAVALEIGIVPTPLVPLYMIYKQARCGIMITASHNPYDQNGIKIFIPPFGIKMLPEDDIRLSQRVVETEYDEIRSFPFKGKRIDCRDEALYVFERFLLKSKNSWITHKDTLLKLIVIVDCANGSYSSIAAGIFQNSGVKKVVEVSNDVKHGRVNEECGVVDFENVSLITQDMAFAPSGLFYCHEAVQRLFELGRKNREDSKSGKVRVAACVFDADGDRFNRLDYNPFSDNIIVQNGDCIACHQAEYFNFCFPDNYKKSLYVNTVESDMGASQEVDKMGFRTKLTAVGDKWILWWTTVSLLKSMTSLCKRYAKNKDVMLIVDSMLERVNKLEQSETERLKQLNSFVTEVERWKESNGDFHTLMKKVEVELSHPGVIKFAVGSENSGHTITFGYLKTEDGDEIPVFSGNGLKSAINSFAATERLYSDISAEEYFYKLQHPFLRGFKKTWYVYYTDKSLVKAGTDVWNEAQKIIEKEIKKFFSDADIRVKFFTDDPDLLYVGVYNKSGNMSAGVYIRNSGTEDKTSVNVTGRVKDADALTSIGVSVLKYLFTAVKDRSKPAVEAEHTILERIYNKINCSHDGLKDGMDGALVERLLKIMDARESLIIRDNNGYGLTELGRWYCSGIGKGEKND